MRPAISKSREAIGPNMEFLHLLEGSSVRFWILDETIHFNDKLSRREDGPLSFNVQRPDLA
jgi:hypothetical protein